MSWGAIASVREAREGAARGGAGRVREGRAARSEMRGVIMSRLNVAHHGGGSFVKVTISVCILLKKK